MAFYNFVAAMVIAFTGHKSMVTITSPTFSDIIISSMVLQFKTADPNSELAAMIFGNELFTLNILNGKLVLQYNFNQTGNGTFDLGMNYVYYLYNILNLLYFSTLLQL